MDNIIVCLASWHDTIFPLIIQRFLFSLLNYLLLTVLGDLIKIKLSLWLSFY